MRTILLLLAGIAGAASSIEAQQPSAKACSGAEHRALDFWVGDWEAFDDKGQRIGSNHISRDEYGDCVIAEHFRMADGSMIGHSVSIYRPGLKQWRQTWVDSQNGFFDLTGGPVSGGDHIFALENKRVTETQAHQRMIWQDVKPDSFTWRWQQRAKADDSWADSWVIFYKRKKA